MGEEFEMIRTIIYIDPQCSGLQILKTVADPKKALLKVGMTEEQYAGEMIFAVVVDGDGKTEELTLDYT